jgi:hypothetical protein
VVRRDGDGATKLVDEFNRQFRPDGFVLVEVARISGRVVFGGARVTSVHEPESAVRLSNRSLLEDPTVLRDHLDRLQRTISSDPPAAIAAAKELVESTLKMILDETGVEYTNREDLISTSSSPIAAT